MTKPRTRQQLWYLIAAVIAVALLVVAAMLLWRRDDTPKLQAGGRTYALEVAKTVQQHEKGLGGRTSMPTGQGMLFAYKADGQYCFWMKDMLFSLDIMWLDAGKRVVKLEQNLSPSSYPSSFCPDKPNARYVVELNAGQARAAHLQVGDQLHF